MAENGLSGVDRPIFVLGHARSGTTLVQRVLNTSDQVTICGEHQGFLEPLATSYFTLCSSIELRQPGAGAGHREYSESILGDWRLWPGWTNSYTKESATGAFADCVRTLISGSETKQVPESASPRWGFKEIRYGAGSRVPEFLHALFPAASFVIVVRDPIDVIASAQQMFESRPASEMARLWSERNQTYLELAKQPGVSSHFVSYYELMSDGVAAVNTMFAALGIPAGEGARVRELIASPEGRYQAKSREQGVAPRAFLSGESVHEILAATREVRRALGMERQWVVDSLDLLGSEAERQTVAQTEAVCGQELINED